jgi:hypothetical protein
MKKGLQILIWPILASKKVLPSFSKLILNASFAHAKSPQIDLGHGDNTPSPAPYYSTTNTIQ